MFINISNGIATFRVTKAAFENSFKSQGFRIVGNAYEICSESKDDADESIFVANPQVNEIVDEKEVIEEDISEDELYVNQMLEKPISEWTKGELKRVAKIKNIDLSNAESTSKARQIISKVLN